jgi:hypothetical protein
VLAREVMTDMSEHEPISQIDVDRIATAAARKAVVELMIAMGVNVEDPEALLKMQKDFAHIRKWRESVDTLTLKGMSVAVTVIMTGILGAIWMVFQGRH